MIQEHIDYSTWVGQRVSKTVNRNQREPKPFKSGNKVNIVSGLTVHEQTGKPGFTFIEDNSVVECWRCALVECSDH